MTLPWAVNRSVPRAKLHGSLGTPDQRSGDIVGTVDGVRSSGTLAERQKPWAVSECGLAVVAELSGVGVESNRGDADDLRVPRHERCGTRAMASNGHKIVA
ncbi:MAG: hypothetical protein R3A47_07935 [Polyangiales bacterium]